MNPYSTNFQQSYRSSSIDPYYMKGDVFQRDQRYYDQTISTRRNRTPNKNIGTGSNVGYGTNTGGLQNPNTGGTIYTGSGSGAIGQSGSYQSAQDQQQLQRLRQENQALVNQLQKLSQGNSDFGTSDAVIKMGHYTASKAENATIRDQQLKIKNLQEIIRVNNQKLIKYQKASSQLEIRMNNIQSIDKEIYKQLKSASTRDKELLERASAALARGEGRESIMRILQQIAIS